MCPSFYNGQNKPIWKAINRTAKVILTIQGRRMQIVCRHTISHHKRQVLDTTIDVHSTTASQLSKLLHRTRSHPLNSEAQPLWWVMGSGFQTNTAKLLHEIFILNVLPLLCTYYSNSSSSVCLSMQNVWNCNCSSSSSKLQPTTDDNGIMNNLINRHAFVVFISFSFTRTRVLAIP